MIFPGIEFSPASTTLDFSLVVKMLYYLSGLRIPELFMIGPFFYLLIDRFLVLLWDDPLEPDL